MSLLTCIVLGLIAVFNASGLADRIGQGLVVDILIGVVGAVVGGVLFDEFGQPGTSGVKLDGVLLAVIGAIVVSPLSHALMGRRRVV